MVTINQLKEYFTKDLFSFRQLGRSLYKTTKRRVGYVIGEIKATAIVDNGFWNNDNLYNQFDVKNIQSSGSKIFDGVVDVVKDTHVEKQIQKASEESIGKLVFYVPEDSEEIFADLIFFNNSKNRDLNEPLVSLGSIATKFSLRTQKACGGVKSYEDVISFNVGSFSFFKESVLGNECTFYFNTEEDEDGERREFLSIRFDKITVPFWNLATVDYIVNGETWDAKKSEELFSAINKGYELSDEQSRLDAIGVDVNKIKKKAKLISWVSASVLLIILLNVFPDMSGGVSFLTLVGFIAIGMSGKRIGNKLVKEKETAFNNALSSLSKRNQELEAHIKGIYM